MKIAKTLLTKRPQREIAIFAMIGWALLSAVIYLGIDSTPAELNEWLRWTEIASMFFLTPVLMGGINGGVIGYAVWAIIGRHDQRGYRVIASGVLIGWTFALIGTLVFLSAEDVGRGMTGYWGENFPNPSSRMYQIEPALKTLQINLIVGSVLGLVIGFAVWIMLGDFLTQPRLPQSRASEPRPINPMLMAFAGCVLAIFLSTIAFSLYWAIDAPSGGGGGMGSTMYAVGMSGFYFVAVLPGSALAGAVLGFLWGLGRKS